MNAREVYERLSSQHNYTPEKQLYKAELGAARVTVYRPDGKPEEVYARDVEHFVAKGFGLDAPAEDAPAEPMIGAAE